MCSDFNDRCFYYSCYICYYSKSNFNSSECAFFYSRHRFNYPAYTFITYRFFRMHVQLFTFYLLLSIVYGIQSIYQIIKICIFSNSWCNVTFRMYSQIFSVCVWEREREGWVWGCVFVYLQYNHMLIVCSIVSLKLHSIPASGIIGQMTIRTWHSDQVIWYVMLQGLCGRCGIG